MKDSHLSFLFINGLLLAAVYVLKALQEGQQRGAGSLRGAFVVHLSGATFPKAQQQQNSRQQLTGRVKRQTNQVKKGGEKTGMKRIQFVFFLPQSSPLDSEFQEDGQGQVLVLKRNVAFGAGAPMYVTENIALWRVSQGNS